MFGRLRKKVGVTVPLRDVSSALERAFKQQFSGDERVLWLHLIDTNEELCVLPARAAETLFLVSCQRMFEGKGAYQEMVRVNPRLIAHTCAMAHMALSGAESFSQEFVPAAKELCAHLVYYLRGGINARTERSRAYIGELDIPPVLYDKYYRKNP